MASVTYNGQSFSIDGRRFWILGASIHYARVPADLWVDRIAAARQAGFNTIETACPWVIHESRKGRFVFQGDANLRKFIETCAAAGMRVILRVGPFIGSEYDGGGIPGWLIETPGVVLREANQIFHEHVSRYFRKLLSEIADLQATQGGPIILIQSEHAWECTNEHQADKYLAEVTRFIRENGITIPITNANDLWQASPETIDTWRGWKDLLVHLRQLRSVQPNAPRIVSAFDPADVEVWGGPSHMAGKSGGGASGGGKTASMVLSHLAEILAAGAQPVVSPFHAGTNFGFLAGRIAGQPAGFVTTSAEFNAPLGESGARGEKYHAIRRLITFANNFGHVFADLDPDYHPIVLNPDEVVASSDEAHADRDRHKRAQSSVSVVPLRGAQGRIMFVFAGESARDTSVLLDDGVKLPVHLGEQSVGWYVLDVDIQGSGRLDYANVCPWAIVDRSVVVFFGPEKAGAYLSINGNPLEMTIPSGHGKPLVIEHRGITVVLCNHAQIDATYHDANAVYVGVDGFDAGGHPIPAVGFSKSWVIRKNASIQPLEFSTKGSASSHARHSSGSGAISMGEWEAAPITAHATGESPRYASLEGPETLGNCGAPSGYGWYRVAFNSGSAAKTLVHFPQAADRLHLYMEGKLQRIIGVGPGARPDPLELKLNKGENVIAALVDNLGRFSEGNEIGLRKGLHGHIYEVKELRGGRIRGPKIAEARPIDPFKLRGYIAHRAAGTMSDTRQAIWTFNHTKKLPVIVDVIGAAASGTFILNDHPIDYYAGATGGMLARILIDPRESKHFKRGNNTLRFAPDARQENSAEDIIKHTTIYECLEVLTENATWAFAKWEPPAVSAFEPIHKADAKSMKGIPCWWRSHFSISLNQAELRSASFWLEMNGVSKGQAYINGQNLGRYFTSTAEGKPVGPQTRLYVPGVWLKPSGGGAGAGGGAGGGQRNEVMVFDEHGFDAGRVRILHGHSRT